MSSLQNYKQLKNNLGCIDLLDSLNELETRLNNITHFLRWD